MDTAAAGMDSAVTGLLLLSRRLALGAAVPQLSLLFLNPLLSRWARIQDPCRSLLNSV